MLTSHSSERRPGLAKFWRLLETIAVLLGEDPVTIEDVYEPFLMQMGFLYRTPRGRCVAPKAYEYLGIEQFGQQTIG